MQLANLSQPECEIVFLHWVVTERNLLPKLSLTERLTCPVLWCHENFDNDDSLLCHLKGCPHLSASSYWCPRCHRAESFASYKIPVPRPSYQTPVQKKPSLLKKLLQTHFSRKGDSDTSQNSTMKPKLHQQEFYSYPTHRTGQMDDQGLPELNDPSGLPYDLEASGGTWGQQKNTLDSPNTLVMNSALFEMDNRTQRFEKDGDMVGELPTDGDQRTGNTSVPEYSQFNEPPHQSSPVLDFFTPEIEELIQQTMATSASGFGHIGEATFHFDHQDIPFLDCQALQPRHSGYEPSITSSRVEAQRSWYHQADPDHAPRPTPPVYPLFHTQNLTHSAIEPTINPINFLADGQKGQPNPETGPVNSPLATSYNQSNSNESMGAGSSTRLPTHSSYGPSHWTEFQTPGHLQARPGHEPRSRTSGCGLLHTQNLTHISIKPTINTTNFPAGGQGVRQGHPNLETGPVNSPLSASSNQTNTTGSNGSMGTVLTPLTPFSDSDSPTGLSPRNVFNSSAQSSENPRQNGHTCKTCGRTLTDASNLRRHEKHKHGEVDPTPCRKGCGQKFTRRDNEERHYENHCKTERSGSDTKRRKARRFGVVYLTQHNNS